MKKIRLCLVAVLIFLQLLLLSGCWNYREIDEVAIVAGIAIDKGKEKKFEATVEIVEVSHGKESQPKSKVQSSEGDTIFDAVRNQIAISGKRLYWAHSKVIIIGQDIAREGILSILDWYNRDSETRGDVDILISQEETARAIFESKASPEEIKSFIIEKTIANHKSLSKAPETQIWEIVNHLSTEGLAPVVPIVTLEKDNGTETIGVIGTAVFKLDKLVGFLNEEDTKTLLFIKDQIKGGVLVQEEQVDQGKIPVSLEIFNSKTKIKPKVPDEKIEMMIEIDLTLAIDEIEGTENFMEEEKIKKLEKDVGDQLKKKIEDFVKKVQSEFNADIFGFGSIIGGDKPQEWKKIYKDWDKRFKEIQVTVEPKINIKNSAMMALPLKLVD